MKFDPSKHTNTNSNNQPVSSFKAPSPGNVSFAAQRAKQTHASMESRVGKHGPERRQLNAYLKARGYNWVKLEVGTEDAVMGDAYAAGFGEYSHSVWRLIAPDGRTVTVAQAMNEIKAAL